MRLLKILKYKIISFFDPIIEFSEDFKEFVLLNHSAVLSIIVLTVLSFGFMVTNFTLSIDEELKIATAPDSGAVAYGRFGIYFFEKFFFVNERFTPFFTDFLAAAFLGLASLLFLFVFEEKLKEQRANFIAMSVFSGLFISFPFVIGDYMSFGVYNSEIGFGYMLTALSLYFSKQFVLNRKYNNLIYSLIFLVIPISIYQSFISVYISATLIIVLIYLINDNKIKKWNILIKQIVVNIVVLCASIIAYFLLNKYFQHTIASAYGYIDGYIGWNKGVGFWKILLSVFQQIKFILLGKFDSSGIIILTSMVLFSTYTFFKGFYLKDILKILSFFFLTLFFILSPFILMLLLGTTFPGRALQALPLLLGGMWYFILKYPIENISKKISIAISVFLVFYQIQFLNLMFYGDYLRYENDIFIGHQIMLSLEENEINYKNKPIIFVGRRKFDSSKMISKINCGGMSFFEDPFRDKNQMYRITFFLKSLGYEVLNASYEEMEIGRKNSDKMKNWPLDGSIKEIDSLIIVKLSED